MLLLLRFGCGLTEAGAYPASASLLSRWVPAAQRGLASGIVSIGGRLGGAVAPVLTAYLVVAFVPLETPSQLTPADVSDPVALCRLLIQPDKKTSASLALAVRRRLPPDTAKVVREAGAADSRKSLDEQQETVLLTGLNQVLLDPTLRDDIDRSEMALPGEKDRGTPRSSAEVERDNRLMLEAGFPTAVNALYRKAWRPVMMMYGGVGIGVGLFFWLFFRDRPRLHPRCNAAEIELIEGKNPPAQTAGKATALPFGSIVRDRNLWLVSLSAVGTNFGWVFLLSWFPRYLLEVHKVAVADRSWMTGIPLLVGIPALYLGGWLTDFITLRAGSYRGRCVLLAISRLLAMTAFVSCLWLGSAWLVTAAMVLVSFGTDLGTPAFWAYCQDVGGRHVGSVLGWMNMWGNFGAALSPVLFGALVDRGQWNLMFVWYALAFLVSALAVLGVDAGRPIAFAEAKAAA
jgi:sugar phosphate permease